ncbi:hypothetical protein OG912_04470 [Streptomyces sp. NBC_00464]
MSSIPLSAETVPSTVTFTDILGGYDYMVASLDDGSAISWGDNATFPAR